MHRELWLYVKNFLLCFFIKDVQCQYLFYSVLPLDSLLVIRLECIRGESWIYSMGQKNGLHAFGYNSAESETI